MKKLALILPAFLVMPLAAWAPSQKNYSFVSEEFASAAAHCTADNINPASPKWGSCINYDLQTYYGYQLIPLASHWLVMVRVNSEFKSVRTVLPVALPATTVSWSVPVGYSAAVYQDGNRGWCVGGAPLPLRACSEKPEVAYVKFLENLNKEPKRWPHVGGEHIEPY